MSAKHLFLNGHSIYIQQSGPADGLPVVLLHHGLGSTRSWKEQAHALRAAGWWVVAYDRYGYGRSSPRPELSVPTFEEDIQDLHALLAHLEVSPAALLGHSDGGTIAMYYAAHYPQQVSCLVTVAAHIYVEVKMQPGIQGVRQAFEGDARFRKGLQHLHDDKTESVFWNWYNGWMKPENLVWDMRPTLRGIACPVLVVQGEQDEHATPQHARDIATAIPGAELWLEPGARHMLPQEQPQLFNHRLLEFLGQAVKRESLNV
jgi:pimeloyl-ACP methyl ester carboxylesterase